MQTGRQNAFTRLKAALILGALPRPQVAPRGASFLSVLMTLDTRSA
jgi:hypothetical protein